MRLRPVLLALVVSGSATALAACSGGGGDGRVRRGRQRLRVRRSERAKRVAEQPGGERRRPAALGAGAAASVGRRGRQRDAAERVVEEADIIKVDGDRLYALSRYGGLAIVDIANPDQMKLLGRKRIEGMPFEMYVQNGRAFVMLNDFGRWVHDETSVYGQWVQSSEILALDVTNPAAITEVSHFDVPGTIADSRIVGDAAYVVTYESGVLLGLPGEAGDDRHELQHGGRDHEERSARLHLAEPELLRRGSAA